MFDEEINSNQPQEKQETNSSNTSDDYIEDKASPPKTISDYLWDISNAKAQIHKKSVVEKIDRMEMLLNQMTLIKHPENFPQLNRLTEYYLPSIVNMLHVYAEMETQEVEGENIKKTRKKIEECLDSFNDALERMHDGMYQDIAMDIASDIKVLKTMLAKDGLGKSFFQSSEGNKLK